MYYKEQFYSFLYVKNFNDLKNVLEKGTEIEIVFEIYFFLKNAHVKKIKFDVLKRDIYKLKINY